MGNAFQDALSALSDLSRSFLNAKDQSRLLPGPPQIPDFRSTVRPLIAGPAKAPEGYEFLPSGDIVSEKLADDIAYAEIARENEQRWGKAEGETGILDSVEGFFVRGAIIVLGFIFVAVGLSMFRGERPLKIITDS